MLLVNAAIVFALVVLNGFFAMSELAVVSARKSRLEQMAKQRKRGAQSALKLAENPTTFLSTVQIGITLVGIFAGAYGGSVFAAPLAEVISGWPVVGPYAQDVAFVAVVVVITYVSLVIGELVPKRFALSRPVWVLEISTKALSRLFGLKDNETDSVTEDDVRAMIAEGTQSGVFKPKEREMLEGVIKIADRNVRSIMIPRPDVDWLDLADEPSAAIAEILKAGHSRFPVIDLDEDEVVGIVQTKDLLEQQTTTGTIDLKTAMRDPLYVNEAMPILKLLERFREAGIHMAIVLDEYGSFEGIATPQDILVAIAGTLPEGSADVPSLMRRKDGSYLVDGALPIDRLVQTFPDLELPAERDYETVAGLVLERMGHIPDVGEILRLPSVDIEIVDLDGRRIDKLLFTPIAGSDVEEAPKENEA